MLLAIYLVISNAIQSFRYYISVNVLMDVPFVFLYLS